VSGPPASDQSPPASRPAIASRDVLPGMVLGVLLGFLGLAFVVTVGVQVPGPGNAGVWAALLLVIIGAVTGYRQVRARGHRGLAIGLLIGMAAGLAIGFGALLAVTAAILGNFT
jgi:hypothetical protein